jgi:hypothetical protein
VFCTLIAFYKFFSVFVEIITSSFHLTDMKKILEIDPSNDQAGKAIRRLEPLAAVKREKMKEEMIGKHFCPSRCFSNIYICTLFLFFVGVCGHVLIAFPVFFIVKCSFF